MAEISAASVKELRERTNAGMMDCKKALVEVGGDIDKAVVWLREKGLVKADKKSGRTAAEGAVHAYIHMGGKIGVLVEVNCETDFVANTPRFREFVHDVALHVAAAAPRYLVREDVPADVIESERAIYAKQVEESGKPANIIAKIVDGRVEKFFGEVCLMEQPFIKDPDKTVEALRKEVVAETGENVLVRRFTRFQLGEGLEKKSTDLAAEVAATLEAAAK